jgi:hypothetical protein
MARLARCCCGSLRVGAGAEPQLVALCHCVECQRGTGSLFGAGAFFRISDVEISGPSTSYVRVGTSGGRVEGHFCPTCGSTVYWFPEKFEGMVGVAVGAFADPTFPWPSVSAWEQSRHEWLAFGHDMRRLSRGVGG